MHNTIEDMFAFAREYISLSSYATCSVTLIRYSNGGTALTNHMSEYIAYSAGLYPDSGLAQLR